MTSGLDLALLLGAAVLLVAVGAVRFSTRLGVPSLLVYLALGVAVDEVLGHRLHNVELTRVLGFCALIVIIAEGGLSARWSTLRPVLGMAAALSTVGVLVSIVVVGAVVHLLLGLEWRLALLYGAVLSSTDAAAVFATLRRLRLPPRLVATLEAESGMNDAPAVIVVLLLSRDVAAAHPWWYEVLLVGYELGVGAAVGVAAGIAGRYALRRAALPAAGLYPIAVVGFTVLAYAVGSVLHASGFLAVYVAGVLLGNARLPHRQAILGFADGLAWLAQIGLFVLLGLLVVPSRLGAAVLPAVVTGLALVLLARPLSVAVSALPFRFRPREQLFLSWAGLRGAVPIVLATIPLSGRVPGADRLFDAVFVLVVIFTLLQAGTLAPVALRLGVTAPAEAAEIRVETAPLERMRADLLQVEVPPGSRLGGVHVDELRLPVGASVTLVLRDGAGFVPGPDTRLKVGDSVLIVATAQVRDEVERRLRAVSRRGRLARWFGEYGDDRGD
ncbi:potassium/proton antiporter, CPA1 family [Micromonospora viridifaciens]|uniref:Potassium/proton antiporter, CPA1 family n=1 Tax=Micromonospora viridifaciens TaxID=1881 RepID=A0A1C4W368_MICVI|nr:potassium/proton antiporter [Micromonospora viridifaciens]SCE90657.1 potassium/proton antiporter, CPA1 family [Micromonospora viridifaciens]